ncbi:hypothetical protein CHS0354_005784, partial [Potamilus streckersoni]
QDCQDDCRDSVSKIERHVGTIFIDDQTSQGHTDLVRDHSLLVANLVLQLRMTKLGEKEKQRFNVATLEDSKARQVFNIPLKSPANLHHYSQKPDKCSKLLSKARQVFNIILKSPASVQHYSQKPGKCSTLLLKARQVFDITLKNMFGNDNPFFQHS